MTQQDTPTPIDLAEETALFRHSVIGDLVGQEYSHGELRVAIFAKSEYLWRPPSAVRTRTYGASTIERWLYKFKNGGLEALKPKARSDKGRGRALSPSQKELLVQIREEFSNVSSKTIIRTLVRNGQLCKGQISVSTLNIFFAERGLPRVSRKQVNGERRQRLRWQVRTAGVLWHSDVCHGPTLQCEGRRIPVRIHALLDDASRYVLALEVHSREREIEMLGLFARALQRHGKPERLYLDNGSTYRGHGLATVCGRLGIGLTHAKPYDPQARGKMERFWRTMRQQCMDFVPITSSLHDLTVRLNAWLDHDYNPGAHAGLMGQTPMKAWETDRVTKTVTYEEMRHAFVVHNNRKLRNDSTLQLDGKTYEVDATFLARKSVSVGHYLAPLDIDNPPFVEYQGRRWTLTEVNATKNGERARTSTSSASKPTPKTGFNPANSVLDIATGKTPDKA